MNIATSAGAVREYLAVRRKQDGLYQIDVGGKNIGYDDQSYYLDASKAGSTTSISTGTKRRMSTAPARRPSIRGSGPLI